MKQRMTLRTLFTLALLLFGGCAGMPAPMPKPETTSAPTPDTAVAQEGTINLAQAANLSKTTQLTIRVFDAANGDYTEAAKLTDSAAINAFVEPLDQPLPLQPALFCMAQYELLFQLADGTVLPFSAGCTAEEEHFLQGGDTPLGDQAIALPVAIQERLAEYSEQ